MKGFLAVAGTVLIGTQQASGKERLNLQQMTIVTPRTAEIMGLSYVNLWSALARATKNELVEGCPIAVRLAPQDPKAGPSLDGLVTTLEFEKAALVPEKNVFVRS